MLEPRLRFIDLATRLLAGKGAVEDLARGEMMDRLAHSSPKDGDDPMEAATARLEQGQPGRFWRSSWFAFAMVLALGGIVAMAFAAGYEETVRFNRGRSPYRNYGIETQQEWEQRLVARVEPSKKIFLLSGTRGVEDEEVNEWVASRFDNPPEDPAEFEETWSSSIGPGNRTPAAFLAHGKRIDPGNGLWAWAALAGEAQAMSGGYRSRRGVPSTTPFSAPPEYHKCLALLEEVLAAPRLETYGPRRTAERLRLLGPPRDLAELADLHAFSLRQYGPYGVGGNVPELWHARAHELASLNDIEGFRKWIASWDRFTLDSLRYSPERRRPFTSPYFIERNVRDFLTLAVSLKATDVETRLLKWQHEISSMRPSHGVAPAFDVSLHAGAFTGASYYYSPGTLMADLVSLDELEPGVKTEHAVADRFAALMGATIFSLLAIVAFFEGWRRSPHLRGMGQGLLLLFRPADYLWVIGLGFVLPLLWYVAWIRFTPLGYRDLALFLGDMLPLVARFIALLLFFLCMLLQAARWRMAKRGGFAGLRPAALWPGWLAAGIAAAIVPLAGLVRYWPHLDEEYLLCSFAVLGFPLLWLLWRGGAILFGPASAALGGVMLCRFLLPVLVLASLLLLSLMPLLKAEERMWMARDQCSGPDPSGWIGTKLNARAEDAMHARLLNAME